MSKPKGLNSGLAMQGFDAWLPASLASLSSEEIYDYLYGDGTWVWFQYIEKYERMHAKRNPRPTGFEKYHKLPRKF